jgi:uncharacterized phage-like protein YoqJ
MIYAATGHRPHLLPCANNPNHPFITSIKQDLIDWLHQEKVTRIISGMATGWDMWVADISLQFNIPLYAYIPFPGQESQWGHDDIQHYNAILDKATEIKLCSDKYHPKAYFKRDKMMVDDADKVIALLDPNQKKGGTFYTVNYALKTKKEVKNFWVVK